jgi:transposase InsO family protein
LLALRFCCEGILHTYLWTGDWLHLAIVLYLFNREVIGWSLKPRMTVDLAMDTLTMAWFRRKPEPSVLHYLDRGSQYASGTHQAINCRFNLVAEKVLQNKDVSMSRITGNDPAK